MERQAPHGGKNGPSDGSHHLLDANQPALPILANPLMPGVGLFGPAVPIAPLEALPLAMPVEIAEPIRVSSLIRMECTLAASSRSNVRPAPHRLCVRGLYSGRCIVFSCYSPLQLI